MKYFLVIVTLLCQPSISEAWLETLHQPTKLTLIANSERYGELGVEVKIRKSSQDSTLYQITSLKLKIGDQWVTAPTSSYNDLLGNLILNFRIYTFKDSIYISFDLYPEQAGKQHVQITYKNKKFSLLITDVKGNPKIKNP